MRPRELSPGVAGGWQEMAQLVVTGTEKGEKLDRPGASCVNPMERNLKGKEKGTAVPGC